eukprot:scaffold36219_cov58-Phaeocystis_antarctica.AAC.2
MCRRPRLWLGLGSELGSGLGLGLGIGLGLGLGAAVLAYGEPHEERLRARRTLEALSVRLGLGLGLRATIGAPVAHTQDPLAISSDGLRAGVAPRLACGAKVRGTPGTPNAQCPMPNANTDECHAKCQTANASWPMANALGGYAHGVVPRGKLPCAACRRPARAPSPHVVLYGCGTGAVHVSTAARPPPPASLLWASPTPYSKSCTSEARRWTLASFRRPDDSRGQG